MGKLAAVDLRTFKSIGKVFVGRGHHEVAFALVAAVECEAAAVVAYSHGEIGEHFLKAFGIVYRSYHIGYRACDGHLSGLTLGDIKLLRALEPALVE